jgi:hypothetical protein
MSGIANVTTELEPNDEIEVKVTPEMIEAGREAIEKQWIEFTNLHGFRLWDKVLTETFRAMTAAQVR